MAWIWAAAVCGIAAATAAAQEDPKNKDNNNDENVVVVTGSRIQRTDEGALPVTVMTGEQIRRSGVANLEQLVQTISATATAGANRGSDLAGLSTYGSSTVSLRGLEDKRTLVLLNGRRLAVFPGSTGGAGSAVDVNAIPLDAIERVEILRDGASSIYGSDAVAGVINFILRKDFRGLQAMADFGRPSDSGGGDIKRANLLFGHGEMASDGYNIMVGVGAQRTESLLARQRSFAASGNRVPFFQNAATPTGRIEGVWIPGQDSTQNARDPVTNPFGISGSGYGNPLAPDRCADINMFAVDGLGGVNGALANCNFDSAPYVELFPETELWHAFGNFTVKLGENMSAYFEANYARNKLTEAYQPSPVRVAFLDTDNAFAGSGVDGALLIYPSNPAYQSIVSPYLQANGLAAMDGQPLAVTLRTFLTGPRTEQDTNTHQRFVAGLQGTAGRWDYDVAAMFNQSKVGGRVIDGYFSQLELARILNDPASNWNPWAAGGVQDAALTEALQATKYVGPTQSGLSRMHSLDTSGSTEIGTLSGGPLALAVGATWRREAYKVDVPAILGLGDIAGLGGATLPEDNARTAYAGYVELNMPWIRSFETNLSGRYDHYNDVGSTTNGKLSARWRPVEPVMLRAAVGTGFRAPTLPELHTPVATVTSEQFVDPAFPENGDVQVNSIRGGNTKLKPEKSEQWSFGVVVTPVQRLSISADVFHIKIDDYITNPSALALINASRTGAPLYGADDVVFAPDGTVDTVNQVNRNAASALVRGLDAGLNWTQNIGPGVLSVDVSGTYMDTFDLKTLAGTQESVGTIIQPSGTPLDIADLGVIVRWKHTLAANWTQGAWSGTLVQSFYRGYRDANDLDGNPHFVPSRSIIDGQVEFTGIKSIALTLGGRNIFNKKPPLFIGNGSSFQYGYDPTMYDPRGRYWYLRAIYDLR